MEGTLPEHSGKLGRKSERGDMEQPKILALVLSTDFPPYDALVEAIKKTWGTFKSDRWRTIYYWNRRKGEKIITGDPILNGDDLIVGCEDSIYSVLRKTLIAYKFALENLEFDYIFRCCCGSYVVPDLTLDFVSKKPRERVWCGITARIPGDPAHRYVSGTGMILSKDVVQMLVENSREVLSNPRPGYVDDIIVGDYLNKIGITPDLDAKRADNKCSPVPGCYHYHVGASAAMIETLHSKLYPTQHEPL